MRVTIQIDSATTEQFRELVRALHPYGLGVAKVGLNGPECWKATTEPLPVHVFAGVVGRLVKFEGVPIADLIPLHDGRPEEFTVERTVAA